MYVKNGPFGVVDIQNDKCDTDAAKNDREKDAESSPNLKDTIDQEAKLPRRLPIMIV